MAEAKRFWLPRSFQANDLTAKVNAFEGLSQMKNILTKPYTDDKIYSSFNQFINGFVESARFDNMLNKYIGNNPKLNPKKFQLLTSHRYDESPSEVRRTYACEGSASLILIYGDPKDRVGAVASIERFSHFIKVSKKNIKDKIREDDLVINQIQGPLYGGNQKMKETFANFRWERMLSEIFIQWAARVGLQRIFFMPSKLNHWDKVANNENGTAFLRYDVTAKRLGFRKQKPNKKYYVLLSDGSREELFKAIFQHP